MDFTTFILENPPQDIDAPIYVDAEQPDRTISWREYTSSIKRIAVGLQGLGLENGDAVALLSASDISYYVLGDGAVAAGGVFAPVSPYGTRHETAQRLKSSNAAWIFCGLEFLEDVKAAAQSIGIPTSRVLVFDTSSPVSGSGHKTYSSLLQSDESAWKQHIANASSGDRTCYRLLTSGSTGAPKGVELSHKVIIARCQPTLRSRSERRVKALHFIDFHHVSATVHCNSSALGVHELHCSKRGSAVETIDSIEKYSIEKLTLYPKLMLEIVVAIQNGVRDRKAIASLRDITVGGSSVPASSISAFKALLPDHVQPKASYGSTEALFITELPEGVPMVPGYVGCYAKDVEVTIVDPETHEDVGPDVDGEICVRSPFVFEKYLNNEAATEAAFLENSKGRWNRTGDKGHFSSSVQQLAITGRYKDVFVVGSEKVSPDEVEATLIQHDAITDVGVTATPDQKHEGLYEPIAYVVAPDEDLTAQQVVDFAAERLSSFKVPTGGVVFCDSIPRTESMHKVVRRALDDISGQPRSARQLAAVQ